MVRSLASSQAYSCFRFRVELEGETQREIFAQERVSLHSAEVTPESTIQGPGTLAMDLSVFKHTLSVLKKLAESGSGSALIHLYETGTSSEHGTMGMRLRGLQFDKMVVGPIKLNASAGGHLHVRCFIDYASADILTDMSPLGQLAQAAED